MLEQEGHPVLAISRRLRKVDQGYAQTKREALAVYQAVMRIIKYLFEILFILVTDHEALQFIHDPRDLSVRSSAAMIRLWCIALSAYVYTVEYKISKHIIYADFSSHYAVASDPAFTSDCSLVQPLFIPHKQLICSTRNYFFHLEIFWRKNRSHMITVRLYEESLIRLLEHFVPHGSVT